MSDRLIVQWLANGETGVSSKTMAFTAMGQGYRDNHHPLDPADLNRCIKLVDEVPEIKDAFPKIAALSKEWQAVIDNWDSLKKSFVDEAGYDWSEKHSAPLTYKKMKDLGL
jgi:hypothetical protein